MGQETPDRPAVHATDHEARAYEQTVVLLLKDWIARHGGGAHGHSGLLLDVDVEGERPSARLVLHYRSHAGGEYDAHWPLWDTSAVIGPLPEQAYFFEAPDSLVGIVVANWLDGSIRAADDPYWTNRRT